MWFCPSYMRPIQLQRLAEAWRKTAPNTALLVRLHEDDPFLDEYQELEWPSSWTFAVDVHAKAVGSCNWAYAQFPNESFYGFIGDDVVPKTAGWAEKLEAAAGLRSIAYPNDLIHREALCTHPCLGGHLVRAAGWWALPSLDHNFMDTVWSVIGQRLNILQYHDDIIFDHRHPIVGKAVDDGVYELGRLNYAQDEMEFRRWVEEDADEVIRRIEKVL